MMTWEQKNKRGRVRKKEPEILGPRKPCKKLVYEKDTGFKNGNALQLFKEAWQTCKLHMIS